MQFLLPAIYLLLFTLMVMKLNFFSLDGKGKRIILALLAIKVIAAAFVYLLYTYYYPLSDFHTYFSDSKILISNWSADVPAPLESWNSRWDPLFFNGSRIMILLNAFLHLFSFGNIYVHVLFFCFLSFAGSIALCKAFLEFFPLFRNRILLAVFLVPTLLFWGSSPLKEGLITGLIGFFVFFSRFGLARNPGTTKIVFMVILFFLIASVKLYVALALLPVLIVNFWVGRSSNELLYAKYLIVFLSFSGIAILLSLISPDYNVLRIISERRSKAVSEAKGGAFYMSRNNFIRVDYFQKDSIMLQQSDRSYKLRPGSSYVSWPLDNMSDTTYVSHASDTNSFQFVYDQQPANSVRHMKKLEPEPLAFIAAAPLALLNVLARPSVFESTSWLHFFAGLENLYLMLLIIIMLFFYKRPEKEQAPVLMFCIVFSIVLFLLIGFTVPAMGAMLRYRVPALLFLVPALLCLTDKKRLLDFISRKKDQPGRL
jgi:hypothetical protein